MHLDLLYINIYTCTTGIGGLRMTARNIVQRVAADSWFDMFYMHDRVWFFKVCLKADHPGLLISNVRCPLSNDMRKYIDGSKL